MLETSVLGWLKEHLLDNEVVLFLGAGFSSEAVNKLGSPLPMSSSLVQELYEHAGFSESRPYAGERLEDVFEAARLRIGESGLLEFLRPRLSVASVLSWYSYVADFLWYRIYTTNVDNVLEEAWNVRKTERPDLQVIIGLEGEFVERDQLLGSIQYVKLNGSLERGIKGVTFSRRQYSARIVEQDVWVDQFVRDYFSQPTVFIGTELEDPILWSYIERRERMGRKKGRDPRPRALLVSPEISPAKEPVLESLHIEPVRVTARQFFETLHTALRETGNVETVLRRVFSRRRIPVEVAASFLTREVRQSLAAFHSCFQEVKPKAKDPDYQGYYLLGTRPTWGDLAAGWDAERDITAELERLVKEALGNREKPRVVFLKGTAGSGKSTILMRLAWGLRQEGVPCFFGDGEAIPEWQDIRVALEGYQLPIVVCLDNAHKFLWDVSEWSGRAGGLTNPPVVVCASRINQFERNIGAVSTMPGYNEVEIPDLSDGEIVRILDILAQEQFLGVLRGSSKQQRFKIFKEYARRQILVAMREATSGEGFDRIIADEFARLPLEGKTVYAITALPSSQHHTITQKELIAASPYSFVDTMEIVGSILKGIVIKVEPEAEIYQVRHPIIAEMVVDSLAPRDMLRDAYVGYLRAIAHQIPQDVRRGSRAWQIFWRLLNHRNLYRQFGGSVDHARSIYESLKRWFGGNGHFWLQYGALEVEYGNLDSAENFIAQAKVLLGEGHNPVMATYAHLLLKKGNRSGDMDEAVRLKEEGERILLAQIATVGRRDPIPYHILGSQTLSWLRYRVEDRQARRKGYERLKQLIEEAVKNHTGRQELKDLLADITRDYLMMAVP